jgi:hypothetical protein
MLNLKFETKVHDLILPTHTFVMFCSKSNQSCFFVFSGVGWLLRKWSKGRLFIIDFLGFKFINN